MTLPKILLCLIVAYAPEARAKSNDSAQAKQPGLLYRIGDTIGSWVQRPVKSKPLGWKAAVIPATLIAYGTLSVTTNWFDDVNLLGRDWASNNEDPNRKTKVDDYTQSVPALAVYGLNIAGVRGKNNPLDASMMYAAGLGIAHVITVQGKKFTARHRPDSSDRLSFPSGHTSTAFVSAEFLRQEYKDVSPWIGAGGYAVAIVTGYLRMYNNKHWFSDVVAGAGVGILSTRLSYWLYPKLKNTIIGKSAGGTTMVLPVWQPGNIGLCVVHSFR